MVRKRKVTLWTPGVKSLLWNLELKWLVERPGMQRLWTVTEAQRSSCWRSQFEALKWCFSKARMGSAGIPKSRLDVPTNSLSLQQQCGGYQEAQQEATVYLILGLASAAAVFENWWSLLSFLPFRFHECSSHCQTLNWDPSREGKSGKCGSQFSFVVTGRP